MEVLPGGGGTSAGVAPFAEASAPQVMVAGVEAEGPTCARSEGTTWHSPQATGSAMALAPGSRCPWWAPTPRCAVLDEPFRSTGGAAFTSAGVPGGTTRLTSPWHAAQLVIMSGRVRSTTALTCTFRFTLALVNPGWQSAHWTPVATAGCQALVSMGPPGLAWQEPQEPIDGGFQTGMGRVPPPRRSPGPPEWQ